MFAMFLAHELGKTWDEIKKIPIPELILWIAYFNVKSEIEKKEIDKATRKSRIRRRTF